MGPPRLDGPVDPRHGRQLEVEGTVIDPQNERDVAVGSAPNLLDHRESALDCAEACVGTGSGHDHPFE